MLYDCLIDCWGFYFGAEVGGFFAILAQSKKSPYTLKVSPFKGIKSTFFAAYPKFNYVFIIYYCYQTNYTY